MSEQRRSNIKDGIIDFVAGSLGKLPSLKTQVTQFLFVGGAALVYVGQPLDTVKVKMQTFPSMYKNMFNCFVETLRHDGIYRGLYAGTVPALAANITENSVLFFCYGLCQKGILTFSSAENVTKLSSLENATAGFLASFFSSVAICPPELLKCKLQAMYEVQKKQALEGVKVKSVTLWSLSAQIFRQEGVVGFFHGLVPTLVREMPGYFFFFGAYEGEFFLVGDFCLFECGRCEEPTDASRGVQGRYRFVQDDGSGGRWRVHVLDFNIPGRCR